MPLCSRCIASFDDGTWWCPFCGRRARGAPPGAPAQAPTALPAPVVQLPPYRGPAIWPDAPFRFVTRPHDEDAVRAQYRRRARRGRTASVFGAVIAAAGLVVGVVAIVHAARRPSAVTVHLENEGFGAPPPGIPVVRVGVGADRSVPVDLDTGSVGLRVFGNLLPSGPASGITRTGRRVSASFADGERLSGDVAYATVAVGGLRTTARVPFELVTRASCVSGHPQCPGAEGIHGLEAAGSQGIMGIGLSGPEGPGDPTDNPLLRLPGPYRNSWSISLPGGAAGGGRLVLGAPEPPDTEQRAAFQLTPGGVGPDGTPAWGDFVYTCWTVGSTQQSCGPTLFDTGSSSAVAEGAAFHVRVTANQNSFHRVASGLKVRVGGSPRGQLFWSFRTGSRVGVDTLVTTPGHRLFSSGMQLFRSFTVTYDVVDGTITLSRSVAATGPQAAPSAAPASLVPRRPDAGRPRS